MNLNIGQKLTIGFSILLLLMGIISIASYLSLNRMREATDLVYSRVNASANMNRLRQKMEEALSSNAFAIMGDVEEKITFDLKIKSMEDLFNATAQYELGEKRPLLETVRTQYRNIQEKTNFVYKIAEEEGKDFDDNHVEELVAQIEDIQISMIENMQALVLFLGNWIGLAVSQADETKRHGIFVTGTLSVIAIIFSMIAAFLLTQNITKPVRSLVAATQQVAEGNLEARIESLRNDEIGKLNQSFNQMTDQLYAAHLQVTRVNKELEAFSYSVSHDLRAPLRRINGFAQALLEDYGEKLDSDGKDFIRRVVNSTQDMANLVGDLLTLSRASRGDLHRGKVQLSQMAEVITSELMEAEPDRPVEFYISKGIVANGDERLLRALMTNLLSNAWKYTGKEAHPKIEFGTIEHNGKTAYFVRDNGAGFSMDYVEKLFAPFQRLHTSDEFEGTGIGLATVQRIVNRHEGRIWAEATVGEGATFYFTL